VDYFKDKLRKEIDKKFALLFFDLPTLNKEELALKLNECMLNIKSHPLYSAVPGNEAVLIDASIDCNNRIIALSKAFSQFTHDSISNPLAISTNALPINSPRKDLRRTQKRKSIANFFDNKINSESILESSSPRREQ